jgi:hypothetical protein
VDGSWIVSGASPFNKGEKKNTILGVWVCTSAMRAVRLGIKYFLSRGHLRFHGCSHLSPDNAWRNYYPKEFRGSLKLGNVVPEGL